MHQTETNYCFDRLDGLEIKTEFGFELNTAYACTARGCLNIADSPLAVAEISAKDRCFNEATQLPELQRSCSRYYRRGKRNRDLRP